MYDDKFYKFLTYFDPELTVEQAEQVIDKELDFINKDIDEFCDLLNKFTPDKCSGSKYDLFNNFFEIFKNVLPVKYGDNEKKLIELYKTKLKTRAQTKVKYIKYDNINNFKEDDSESIVLTIVEVSDSNNSKDDLRTLINSNKNKGNISFLYIVSGKLDNHGHWFLVIQNGNVIVVDSMGADNDISESMYDNFIKITPLTTDQEIKISSIKERTQYSFSNDCEFLSIMMAINLIRLYKFNCLNYENILSTLPNNTNEYKLGKLIMICFNESVFSKNEGNFDNRIQTLETALKMVNESEKLYYSHDVTLNDITKNVVGFGLHLIKYYQIKENEISELLCNYTREILNKALNGEKITKRNFITTLSSFVNNNIKIGDKIKSYIEKTEIYKKIPTTVDDNKKIKPTIEKILIKYLLTKNSKIEKKELNICTYIVDRVISNNRILLNFIKNLDKYSNEQLDIIEYKNYIYDKYQDQTKNIIDFDKKGSVLRYCYGLVNAIFHKINTLGIKNEQIFNKSYEFLNENEKGELENYIIEKSHSLTELTRFILINENDKIFQNIPYEDFDIIIEQKNSFIKSIKDIIKDENVILGIYKEQQLFEETYSFTKKQLPNMTSVIVKGIILTLNTNGIKSKYKSSILIGILKGLKHNQKLENSVFDYLKNNEDTRHKIMNDLNTLANNDGSRITKELIKEVRKLINIKQKDIKQTKTQPMLK